MKRLLSLQRQMIALVPSGPASSGPILETQAPSDAAPGADPKSLLAEMATRGKRVGICGGVLDLLALVILALMVFKPF